MINLMSSPRSLTSKPERMRQPIEVLAMYLELARASAKRQRPLVSARFLVLSMSMACQMGLERIARYCRTLILEQNPHHLVRNWLPSDGSDAENLLSLTQQLKRRYPLERAEQLLSQLNICVEDESHLFADHEEYAAHVLGETPQSIAAKLDRE